MGQDADGDHGAQPFQQLLLLRVQNARPVSGPDGEEVGFQPGDLLAGRQAGRPGRHRPLGRPGGLERVPLLSHALQVPREFFRSLNEAAGEQFQVAVALLVEAAERFLQRVSGGQGELGGGKRGLARGLAECEGANGSLPAGSLPAGSLPAGSLPAAGVGF